MKILNIQLKEDDKIFKNPLSTGFDIFEKCVNEDYELIKFDFQDVKTFPPLFSGFLNYFKDYIQTQAKNIKIEITNLPEDFYINKKF